MSDGFDEDTEFAQEVISHQQKELLERKELAEQEDFMETLYDFHKFTADPALKRLSSELRDIDKNWVLGNYVNRDESIILLLETLISDVKYLLPGGSRNNLIQTALFRDIHSQIAVSRGRGGFAAKLFVTQIGTTKAEISGLSKEKRGLKNMLSLRGVK